MKIIKKLIYVLGLQKLLLILVLKFHNLLYAIVTKLAIVNNQGKHPKHEILKYEKWFLSQVDKQSVLLNIGSHGGEFEELASSQVNFLYGIEIVEKLVTKANAKKIPNTEFFYADANLFDFTQLKEIDAVILSNVLEHIAERENLLVNLINKVKFKNGPRFLIRIPVIDRDWIPVLKKQMGIEYRLDPTHVVELSSDEWLGELKKLGLTPKKIKFCYGEIWGDFRLNLSV